MKKVCSCYVVFVTLLLFVVFVPVEASSDFPYTHCPFGHMYDRIVDDYITEWGGPITEPLQTYRQSVYYVENNSYTDSITSSLKWSYTVETGIISGWRYQFGSVGFTQASEHTTSIESQMLILPREEATAWGTKWTQIERMYLHFVSKGYCSVCGRSYSSYVDSWVAHNQDEWLRIDWEINQIQGND